MRTIVSAPTCLWRGEAIGGGAGKEEGWTQGASERYLAKLSTYPPPMKKCRDDLHRRIRQSKVEAGSVGSSASYVAEKEEGDEQEANRI